MNKIPKIFLAITLAFFISACAGHKDELVKLKGQTMGTSYTVKFIKSAQTGLDKSYELSIHASLEALLDTINKEMSTYIPDSDISMFNKAQDTLWHEVPAPMARLAADAAMVSKLSSGAFDITVGPLVNLWGFGKDKKEDQVPTDDTIALAKQRCGYHKLEVSVMPPRLRKSDPMLMIDMAAIAKGYGVDRVAELLSGKGIEHYYMEIGGEVRCAGVNDKGLIWRIGIESPSEQSSLERIVNVDNMAVATSGDYHNYFEKDGLRYSHTIDPATGRPITHKLASVSVMDKSCARADAWATALNVSGPEKGMALAKENGIEALFIIKSENGFVVELTDGFKKVVENTKGN